MNDMRHRGLDLIKLWKLEKNSKFARMGLQARPRNRMSRAVQIASDEIPRVHRNAGTVGRGIPRGAKVIVAGVDEVPFGYRHKGKTYVAEVKNVDLDSAEGINLTRTPNQRRLQLISEKFKRKNFVPKHYKLVGEGNTNDLYESGYAHYTTGRYVPEKIPTTKAKRIVDYNKKSSKRITTIPQRLYEEEYPEKRSKNFRTWMKGRLSDY